MGMKHRSPNTQIKGSTQGPKKQKQRVKLMRTRWDRKKIHHFIYMLWAHLKECSLMSFFDCLKNHQEYASKRPFFARQLPVCFCRGKLLLVTCKRFTIVTDGCRNQWNVFTKRTRFLGKFQKKSLTNNTVSFPWRYCACFTGLFRGEKLR